VFPDPQTLAIGMLNFLTFLPFMELFSKKISRVLNILISAKTREVTIARFG
jgi:hypothetical protein